MMTDKLVKSMVPDARVWRLALRIEPRALHVMAYSTVEDNSLIYRAIPLEGASTASGSASAAVPLKALEEAIYDNPLLLSDFDRVYCVVATDRFIVAPTPMTADADDCELMMRTQWPGWEGEIISNPTGTQAATILMGLDSDLAAFLNRTFISPRIMHHLSPLCRYFTANSGKGNSVKTYLHLRPSSLDLIIIDRGRLLMANTFSYTDITDALYYTLASRAEAAGAAAAAGEIYVSGDSAAREALMPRLRDYAESVMPVIFPSAMFRLGKDAVKAPFDLIVLPLCE